MECWLITSRSEVRRLEFDFPPDEICLPDKPLGEMENDVPGTAIQDSPYIIYSRHDLAGERSRIGIVYSVTPPTEGDIRIISAHSAGKWRAP